MPQALLQARLQEIVAFALVLAAAGYATWSLWLRRRWRARQARAAAAAGLPVPATGGGCSNCESAPPTASRAAGQGRARGQ